MKILFYFIKNLFKGENLYCFIISSLLLVLIYILYILDAPHNNEYYLIVYILDCPNINTNINADIAINIINNSLYDKLTRNVCSTIICVYGNMYYNSL